MHGCVHFVRSANAIPEAIHASRAKPLRLSVHESSVLKLQPRQPGVEPVMGDEFCVGALFDDSP
jgi:hypothetical protein